MFKYEICEALATVKKDAISFLSINVYDCVDTFFPKCACVIKMYVKSQKIICLCDYKPNDDLEFDK